MTMSDWAIVFATFFGPVFAVQAQKWIEKVREQRMRQEWIFRTLMATRLARLSPEHVRALNMIPLDFRGQRNKVAQAWKLYLDQINSLLPGASTSPEVVATWVSKNDDFFNALLIEMAKFLGYDFDPIELKREVYRPMSHEEQERVQFFIQQRLADILAGRDALPMKVTSVPVNDELIAQQIELNKKLARHLDGEKPLKVKLEQEDRM